MHTVFYGRWLANKWGIDPKAKTPATEIRRWKGLRSDRRLDCISHISFPPSQVQALSPVPFRQLHLDGFRCLLWVILIGGIFFGAVTDFGALYASVKNEGKSMGLLIEKYIGKTRTKVVLVCSVGCLHLIVIAAFADMVAGTFNAYTVADGVTSLADGGTDQRRGRFHLPDVHCICHGIWCHSEDIFI